MMWIRQARQQASSNSSAAEPWDRTAAQEKLCNERLLPRGQNEPQNWGAYTMSYYNPNVVYSSTPQLYFKIPQIPSNRGHKAINRGSLGV